MGAAAAANQEDLAESMALIKDIVPGYGDGFIEACLKACNGNAQRAVNMLLEKKFPEPLAHMDPKMPKAPGHFPRTLMIDSTYCLPHTESPLHSGGVLCVSLYLLHLLSRAACEVCQSQSVRHTFCL